MKTEIKWYFQCDVDSADKAFAKLTSYANFYKAMDDGKVEYVDDFRNENTRLAYVEWPSNAWPELTNRDFFNLMTECLDGNLMDSHSFGVQAIANGGKDDKEQIVNFTHEFRDNDRTADAGELIVYPQAASAEYAEKLRQIEKIVRIEERW